MKSLYLHEVHETFNARFGVVNDCEVVSHYGDWKAEYAALTSSAAVMDLSFRSRLCIVGTDRASWLNGQVTNNIKNLQPGSGCYAALVSAKGKIQSDLNVFVLQEEILLDFEPGLSTTVTQRLEAYIIADDVQIVDASDSYGLLSLQGPRVDEVLPNLGLNVEVAQKNFSLCVVKDATLGEICIARNPRFGTNGFDLFIPAASLGAVFDKLFAACRELGGGICGFDPSETARIEAGIPRYGVDMDESNLVPEAGIGDRAISYAKGCYIGQEVIARIRTYGQVTKALRGLILADDLKPLPLKGTRILNNGTDVGYLASTIFSPRFKKNIAMGYVRKEVNQPGTKLSLALPDSSTSDLAVVSLPFE